MMPFDLKECSRECGSECSANLAGCPTYNRLPEPVQQLCQSKLYLLRYLHHLDQTGIALPEYHDKLTRSQSGKSPNILYQVDDDEFVHILPNPEDIRNHYIIVVPSLGEPTDGVLDALEERLADHVKNLEYDPEQGSLVNVLLELVDELVLVKGGKSADRTRTAAGKDNGENGINTGQKKAGGMLKPGRKIKDRIVVTPVQYQSLRHTLRCRLEGLGILEPMIRDPYIEDVSCSGVGNIFVEHKIFKGLKASIGFQDCDELDKFVIQLAESIKRPVTFRQPCVDASLPDGSRINIVYGVDVSKRGSNFTIRKFSQTPMSVIELIQLGSLNYEMAAYLSLMLQQGMNVWVSGETASGKTTLLNALTAFVPPDAKIVSIEDTAEIQVPHPNWIRGVTRGTANDSKASEVSMFDLLKAALRQRPNLIIVGEIRGAEGAIAFQAMQTGHACMSTFHAASVTKLVQRLTGNPISVPKTYVDNLNVVIIAQAVRLPNGRSVRRITSINEIVGYDSVSDSFSFMEVFTWNPFEDAFIFKGHMNSFLLEEKIAPKLGVSHENIRKIYSEIKRRAEVLKKIQAQEITDFYNVYAVLSKAYREGLFR
ncbi:MAG: type II/IV secretion system ATPase subunit [Chloroflexi bacterium]|nr:type II/IV secretion system ATPase subunit [Chloroflexota bacterium]